VVTEFVHAALRPGTYDPRRSSYLWFGLLWGLPIPLCTLLVDCWSRGLPLTPSTARDAVAIHPFQAVFLLHPVLFAALFAVLGAIRGRKQEQIDALVGGLREGLDRSQHANRRLEELRDLRDREVAQATHEMKSPLSTISGYSELLLAEELGALDPAQRDALAACLRSIDGLNRMIDDLLVAAALDGRRLVIAAAPTCVASCVEAVVASLAPVARRRGAEVRVSAPGRPRAMADGQRLEHVLANLLSNALRYGGTAPRVEIAVTTEGEAVRVTVTDDGPGVPAEELPHLGERFHQITSSGEVRRGGTGLGLHIVKGILEAHGTRLEVTSSPGKGAAFSFLLSRVR
jgi:signal transduction histidine kinase